MRGTTYQIDQSGKIEDTTKDTILALSNGQTYTIAFAASDKRVLQGIYWLLLNKPRSFIYQTFSALLVILLENVKLRGRVIVDTEYQGQASVIKAIFSEIWSERGNRPVSLEFSFVERTSSAHGLAYKTFKQKLKPDKKVSLDEVMALLFRGNKKDRVSRY